MLNISAAMGLLAAAGDSAPSAGSGLMGFVPLLLMFGIMYFLLIRPQQVKAKEHREMVARLKVGDRVVTNGGLRGEIAAVQETTVRVKVAEKVQLEFVRTAIHTVESEPDASDGKKG